MLILSLDRAPLLGHGVNLHSMKYDGLIEKRVQQDGGNWVIETEPGAILELWRQLRIQCGTLQAKKKDGVKFKVRAAEDLIDKIAGAANDLGILIYPSQVDGKGHVVEDGTLAELNMVVIAQAISDGSKLSFMGFGLGADNQDKAGGKAGTYAFKQALVQALLAGGGEAKAKAKARGGSDAVATADTDDSDTPIPGGVKRPTGKVKAPTAEEMTALFEGLVDGDEAGYKVALGMMKQTQPEVQLAIRPVIQAARARCMVAK